MKRLIIRTITAIVIMLMILSGCQKAVVPAESNEIKAKEIKTFTTGPIVDTVTPLTEVFYDDGMYLYFFSSFFKETVCVVYTDGTSEPVEEALYNERITLDDLSMFVSFHKKPKVIEITDRTVTENIPTDEALEGFHADDEYVYYFPSIKSHYVTVKYSDQSEKPVKEALYHGDITITDLDRYGIGYGKRSHAEDGDGRVKKIVYDIICYSNGGESDTEEIFYENSDYVYSFPNPLSQYITVLFTDGTQENLIDAFEHSDIVPYDLISAGIPFWEKSKLDGSATFYSDEEVYYHEP